MSLQHQSDFAVLLGQAFQLGFDLGKPGFDFPAASSGEESSQVCQLQDQGFFCGFQRGDPFPAFFLRDPAR